MGAPGLKKQFQGTRSKARDVITAGTTSRYKDKIREERERIKKPDDMCIRLYMSVYVCICVLLLAL